MSIRHLINQALRLSLKAAIPKVWDWLSTRAVGAIEGAIKAGACSYPDATPGAPALRWRLASAVAAGPAPDRGLLLDHRFELLGSGPRTLSPAPENPLNAGNRTRAGLVRGLIDGGYTAIDWHVDFRSGYRWPAASWHSRIAYGHVPGADIKVPWELGRLQHLPRLAIGADARAARECVNQMLDFIAANPPGFGVNWASPMEVAIRAANVAVALDLLHAGGHAVAGEVLAECQGWLRAHARHIVATMGRDRHPGGNHLLADWTGLLFTGAYLPDDAETAAWWALGRDGLIGETARQFLADGANFEASTNYHRLAGEIVVYGAALIAGVEGAAALPGDFAARLAAMARFTHHVTKPGGLVHQVGDTDDGRFFRLGLEPALDHRGFIAAVAGLVPGIDAPPQAPERLLVEALAGGSKLTPVTLVPLASSLGSAGADAAGADATETIIAPPDAGVLQGLEAIAYPDFGLYIWRGPRAYLAIRCGAIGQNGRGGHAHNDQLAVELNIDGEDWLADPGSYVYTADPETRDAYRSVAAHAAPRLGRGEPARLDLGLFRLGDTARAECSHFDGHGFEGRHRGYGPMISRRIRIETARIVITDHPGDTLTRTIRSADQARQMFAAAVAFSPGYGQRKKSG